MNARHRIQTSGRSVTAVRERIERVLHVTTTARPEGHTWGVYFDAPDDVSLDFLRPDVLPPAREEEAKTHSAREEAQT